MPTRQSPLNHLLAIVALAVGSTGAAAETFRVEAFRVAWAVQSDMLPPADTFNDTSVRLDRTARAYTAATPGAPAIRTDLGALSRQGLVRIETAGLDAIADALTARMTRDGLIGTRVHVSLSPIQAGHGRTAWFVLDVPLDAAANTNIPGDLTPLHPPAPEPPSVPTPELTPATTSSEDAHQDEDTPDASVIPPPPMPEAPASPEPPVVVAPAPEPIEDAQAETAADTTGVLPAASSEHQDQPAGTTLEGVQIRWNDQAKSWGDPRPAFAAVTVELALVDNVVQADTSDDATAIPLQDLAQFPPRLWQHSAIEAVADAVTARVHALGMHRTGISGEVMSLDDRPVLVMTLSPPARPEGFPPPAHEAAESGSYVVWPFELVYAAEHHDLPPASSFTNLPITLSPTPQGWAAPGGTDTLVESSLGGLNEAGPMVYDAGSILAIDTEIARYLTNHDLMGVAVSPLSSQISTTGDAVGADLRAGATDLVLVISVGRVAEIRTVASGDRVDTEQRMDNPMHERIVANSPLNATTNGEHDTDDVQGHLLRRQVLEDYTHFLSRHPGRDVEASVAAGANPGDVSLDYVISEAKPWTVWYQYGNTGTKSEQYMRNRVGFYTTQLTNNDDILSLEYITSDLQSTNAVMGSYEAPLSDDGRLRWRGSGSWSQYFADQFGIAGLGPIENAFTGFSWAGSGELRWNVHQDGPLFVDLIGGLRLQHIGVNNNILLQSGQASFLIPYGMLQAEKIGEWSNFQASLGIEANTLSHSEQSLTTLGRLDPANHFVRFNWGVSWSSFLEPLIDQRGWNDPSSPESSRLAHEVLVGFSGQYSFGGRLLPQFQQTAGGPTSNRGYPVSVVAGDTVLNLTGEYRLHLPRTFDIQPEPATLLGEPFRLAPQHVYGRPDWDLILLAFVDSSWLFQADPTPGETDETLVSTGIGMEFLFKRNFRVRLDWGWALKSLENGLYDSGHNRLYVQASLYF